MNDSGGKQNVKKSNKNEQNRLKSPVNPKGVDSQGSFSSIPSEGASSTKARKNYRKRYYSKNKPVDNVEAGSNHRKRYHDKSKSTDTDKSNPLDTCKKKSNVQEKQRSKANNDSKKPKRNFKERNYNKPAGRDAVKVHDRVPPKKDITADVKPKIVSTEMHYNKREFTNEDLKALEQFMLRKTNDCDVFGVLPFIRIRSAIEHNNFKQASFDTEWHPLDDELVKIAFSDGGTHLEELYTEPYIAFIKLKALGRPLYAQKKRAIQLGYLEEDEKIIKDSALWSNYELRILREEFPKKGANIPELLKLGRTKGSIKTKAKKEGLMN